MSYSTRLFIFGILISFLVPVIEEMSLQNESNSILDILFSYTPHFWKLGYSVLLVFILPVMIIPKLQKLFVENHFKWYSFLAGNSFGFGIIEIITFSLSAQTIQY
jgi:hypothetical protein